MTVRSDDGKASSLVVRIASHPASEAVPGRVVCEGVSKRYRPRRGQGIVPVPFGPGKNSSPADKSRGVADDEEEEDFAEIEPDLPSPPEERERDIWALRDVNLDLPPGTSLAVLGPNGSGKSTLLKVLTRVTPPTEGSAVVCGRLAPVFGLASAFFQPDQTGRANTFLIADIFGITRELANDCLPDVFGFAGIDRRIDVPMKHYSSGEYIRLAMSLVLNLKPQVVVADDQIAAGDKAFKEACVERLRELVDSGVTLLFATHDLRRARALCAKAALFDSGRVVSIGATDEVIRRYEGSGGDDGSERSDHRRTSSSRRSEVDVVEAGVFGVDGEPVASLSTDDPALVEIVLRVRRAGLRIRGVFALTSGAEERLRTAQPEPFDVPEPGDYLFSALIPAGALADDVYTARVGARIYDSDARSRVSQRNAFAFEVHGERVEADEDFDPSEPERSNVKWGVTAMTGDACEMSSDFPERV